MPLDVSILIVTIKPDEFNAVLRSFPDPRPTPSARGRWINLSTIETATGSRQVAIVAATEQGNGEAQSLTRDLLPEIRPEWVIVTGIAGGRPETSFSLGDGIVSAHVHDFNVHDVSWDKPSTFSVKGGPLHSTVKGYVANLPAGSSALDGWQLRSAVGQDPPSVDLSNLKVVGPDSWVAEVQRTLSINFPGGSGRPPKFVAGEIASSDVLIKDPEHLIAILGGARHVLAVEMESAGVYRAVRDVAPDVRLVAIRGVSDIVGLKRDDVWTLYACQTVASFVRRFVERCPISRPAVSPNVEPPQRAFTSMSVPDAKTHLDTLRAKVTNIRKRLKPRNNRIKKVDRNDLETLIAEARASATRSAISLDGDLSWLPRDLPTLRALRVSRPNVATTIYYDGRGVDADALSTFQELESLGKTAAISGQASQDQGSAHRLGAR